MKLITMDILGNSSPVYIYIYTYNIYIAECGDSPLTGYVVPVCVAVGGAPGLEMLQNGLLEASRSNFWAWAWKCFKMWGAQSIYCAPHKFMWGRYFSIAPLSKKSVLRAASVCVWGGN